MSLLNLYYICSWTATVTAMLSVAVLIYKKAINIIPYKFIGIYLAILFSLDLAFWGISWTDLIVFFKKNTLFSFYLHTINLTLTMTFFFKTYLSNLKKIIIYSGCALIIFTIIEGYFISGFKNFNVYSSFFVYVWLLIFTLLSIRHLILNRKHQSIRKEPLFWIFIGILISVTANTIHNTVSNSLIDYSANAYFMMACFVYLMNIVGNILYAKGFYEI